MKTPSSHSRRQFIVATTAAVATGGILRPGRSRLHAAGAAVRETEHFWFRGGSEGPYVDSQRDNKAFGFDEGKIFLSDDNAESWAYSSPFADAENITFSCLLKNGNVLFATRNKLFLSTDNLRSHHEITVKRPDGSDYIPHTPQNLDQPGWYFHPLDGVHTWDIDGREILVWGNYCNVLGGPVPVNIYYSTDGGETVKLAYSFGRNPHFQEKGTPPEKHLGDATNSIICRHIHNVVYNPDERAFYACTGDINRGHGSECHWLRGTYDAAADRWDWQVVVSVNANSRFKSGGINFADGQVYWAADANGPRQPAEKYDRGIFRCDPKELTDVSKHTQLFAAQFEMANMIIEDGVMIAGHCAPASTFKTGIAYSPDMGKTWREYDLAEFGPRSPVRLQPKNSDGWFRMDLRKGWIERADVLFIKPKV
jgi:hypothetical protein